jgi:hypothetical protein
MSNDQPPNQPPIWPSYQAPINQPTYPMIQPPAIAKKKSKLPWILGGLGAVLLLCCGGLTAIGAASDDTKKDPAATTTPAAQVTVEAAAAHTDQPAPAAPTTTKPPAKPKPITYKSVSDRAWLLIAKNPEAHEGEHIIVYGHVTQFDSATGDDHLRGDVGASKRIPEYGFVNYPTNTLLTGSSARLEEVVEGDLFTAKVTVLGSFSYDTQIGGSTTVPLLQIDSITVTGSVEP